MLLRLHLKKKIPEDMEELVAKHSTIMDKYDPEKRIGMIVDEWGTWFTAEPGTNPGFLYQQNTIRDAMVASITLNIFHKHADRIHMANIAQMLRGVGPDELQNLIKQMPPQPQPQQFGYNPAGKDPYAPAPARSNNVNNIVNNITGKMQ